MDTPATTPRRRRPAPIRWLRGHPFQADLLLAAVLTVISVTFHLADFDPADQYIEPTWWTTALVFPSVFPIAWRRRRTLVSTSIIVVAFIVAALLDVNGNGFLGVVIALYSLGAHGSGHGRTRVVVASALAIGLLFLSGVATDNLEFGDLVASVVVLVTAGVLGDNVRRRRLEANALQERLERAERERELLAQQRVSDERTRIARELHDIVAHSVTGMVIQAAAARRSLDRSPADAALALDRIETAGRSTMNELRNVLGVLRRNHDQTSTLRPGLAGLSDLVASSSDLPTHLSIEGLDPWTLEASDPGLDVTTYRLVQEALTNVRRHAGEVTQVDIEVRRIDDELIVKVTDDGTGVEAPSTPGYGLIGMRERVDTVGGTLRSGPFGSRGWQLSARVPIAAAEPLGAPTAVNGRSN